jgi:V/A-type H+-transporting ATPase subunit K
MDLGLGLALVGAALSISLAGLGTILGTKYIALGSTGHVAQKPGDFGLALLLSALPSSQGIYGFLGSVLILQNLGLLGGEVEAINWQTGMMYIMAALPVGFLGLFSGAGQGQVLQSGLQIVAKDSSNVGQTVILGVLMESMAVFGLLITILVINAL